MPYFRHVGNILKARFDGAVKVMGSNDGQSLIPARQDIKVDSRIRTHNIDSCQNVNFGDNKIKMVKKLGLDEKLHYFETG
jgi:hypothetical protein